MKIADERMYIRCKTCGACYCVAEKFKGRFVTITMGEWLQSDLDEFFYDHSQNSTHPFYKGGFELIYDSDEDFVYKINKR